MQSYTNDKIKFSYLHLGENVKEVPLLGGASRVVGQKGPPMTLRVKMVPPALVPLRTNVVATIRKSSWEKEKAT